jgi:O-acetyl-ADP-ribose deacetylase (regulator of RNase III)
MVSMAHGNILDSRAEALVNTVNTQGVMGKGIVLQFRKAFPEMFAEYESQCKAGRVVIGKMHVWRNTGLFDPKYVINFPTKSDWKHKSRLEYII